MMIDPQARYLKTHEWIKKEEGDNYIMGLSAYVIEHMGDIVYMELSKVGRELKAEEPFGVVESVKTASDIYAPISGTITAVNDEIPDNPDILKKDAYGNGWLVKIKASNPSELETLMDETVYKEFIESEV